VKILSVFGTRPEAIKMAPICHEISRRSCDAHIEHVICVTAQHREMLDQVLNLFQIKPDYDLNIMEKNQSPSQVLSIIISELEPVLKKEKPDWVLVQGDTTTVVAASLAAFYSGVKIGHVEAGLRSYNRHHPFPEEINRKLAGVLADLHFAPTKKAHMNLLAEGIPEDLIVITGNTVIDAMYWVDDRGVDQNKYEINHLVEQSRKAKLILVTAHRRENFGKSLEDICMALCELSNIYNDNVHFVFPVHLNPNVSETVYRLLKDIPNITLIEPLDYLSMVHLIKNAYLILTDSGGIQEEAPGFGVPVLVLREVTERVEGLEAGTSRLIGTNKETIVTEVCHLIDDAEKYDVMSKSVNPYGDGDASKRIVSALLKEKVNPFI